MGPHVGLSGLDYFSLHSQLLSSVSLETHKFLNYLWYGFSLHSAIKSTLANFFFIALFRAEAIAYGGSQTRGLIGAAAAGPHYSNAGSEPYL